MSKGIEWRVLDRLVRHCLFELGSDRSEAIALLEGSPLFPAENGGSVDQDDLLYFQMLGGGFEIAVQPGPQRIEGGWAWLLLGALGDQVVLNGLEDSFEQILLVGEVVVKRPSGPDTCRGDDVFGPSRRSRAPRTAVGRR